MDMNANQEEVPIGPWRTWFLVKVMVYAFCIGIIIFAAMATIASYHLSERRVEEVMF